jgi:hypothetical protein
MFKRSLKSTRQKVSQGISFQLRPALRSFEICCWRPISSGPPSFPRIFVPLFPSVARTSSHCDSLGRHLASVPADATRPAGWSDAGWVFTFLDQGHQGARLDFRSRVSSPGTSDLILLGWWWERRKSQRVVVEGCRASPRATS